MKKSLIIIISFFVVLTIVVLIIFFNSVNRPIYNNEKSIKELVTVEYTDLELKRLTDRIDSGEPITLGDVKKDFSIECMRKTDQGSYLVLLRNDKVNYFIFLNDELQVDRYLIAEEFKRYSDFDFVEKNVTTKSMILNFDSTAIIGSGFSSDFSTKHILKDGLLIIQYNEKDEKVKSIIFYDEEEYKKDSKIYTSLFIPYVIPLDRQ